MHINRLIYILIAFALLSCTPDQAKKENDQKTEEKDKVQTTSSSDTIYISVSMKGSTKRMNILQQKVMFTAKKQLADSIANLENIYNQEAQNSKGNYEVALHDIHVIREGIRYPDANDQNTIEAYITIGMKYKPPIPQIPHESCKR